MLRRALFAFLFLIAPARAVSAADAPVSVMIIGTFHWSNPDRDLHDVKMDDVLAPKRQKEIAGLAKSLSRFRPTQIAVEWSAEDVTQRYSAYLKGTLKPSRNEVVQLGFRLAKANDASIHGIDVEGNFPYEAVQTYAKAHGQDRFVEEADKAVIRQVEEQQRRIDSGTIAAALRWINDPERADNENAFNRIVMKVGHGAEQPGAELFAAWARRNALICANLLQLAKPGDRIIAIFGSGHETFLRQCVRETPGFHLVEASDYLPR
jgi:hypothetical protein